jgi:malate/lactate dehydrogenase
MITIIGAGKVGSAAAFEILRYRISDVVLGKNGIEKIIELKLSQESQQRFDKSVATIKKAITVLKQ